MTRIQYKRTYVLLFPDAGAEWVKAVADGSWDVHRYTIGGSADDAGIGDLDYRRVVAVNPDRWEGDLAAFYREHYPGVEFVIVEAATPSALAQELKEMNGDGNGGNGNGPLPSSLRIGINDPANQGAGRWLRENAPRSMLYVPLGIGPHFRQLNFLAEAQAGIKVIVNLRWGWSTDCGGEGTFPPSAKRGDFVVACSDTIRSSVGVWGWAIGNEVNNPREWPPGERILPDDAADAYNAVRICAPGDNLAPPSVDPYNAELICCREYFIYLWSLIDDAEFADLHGYIRGPDPALVNSDAKFSDEPLQWQGLNYWDCCETLAACLPPGLPIIVSEFNHLWHENSPNPPEPTLGWVNDERAGNVVLAAYDRAAAWNRNTNRNEIMAACMYRWVGDDWAIHKNSWALAAIMALGQ